MLFGKNDKKTDIEFDNYIVCLFDLMGQSSFLELCPLVPREGINDEFRARAEQISEIITFIESFFKKQFQEDLNKEGMISLNKWIKWSTIEKIAYSNPAQDEALLHELAQQIYNCSAKGFVRQEMVNLIESIRMAGDALKQFLSVLTKHDCNFKLESLDYDSLFKKQLNDILCKQKTSFTKAIKKLNQFEIKIQRFSDTFIFYSKLHNKDYDVLLSPLLAYLSSLSILIITLLEREIVLRGSVCYGTGWELNTSDANFYGYALVKAHELESKHADYPRILIDENLYKLLIEARSEDSDINPLLKNISEECLSLCYKDFDGKIALDYLGEYLFQRLLPSGQAEIYTQKVKKAYSWIVGEKEKYFSDPQARERLYPKYEKLEAYFKSRLHYWNTEFWL